jgi:alkyl hydroperoxide reductase subunit AhpC
MEGFLVLDFTFVCPTEIGRRNGDFNKRSADVLGVSTGDAVHLLSIRTDRARGATAPFP